MCGKPVVIKSIDISDPANAALVTNYYVAPIPTFIFFKANGAVDSTLIGRCGADNIAKGMKAAAGLH
jgi:thiol:disulfide interchange protein